MWNSLSCFILLLAIMPEMVESERLPSIMWSPYNPVFSCDEPEIHVKLNDYIKFVCPYHDGGFLIPEKSDVALYENMYMVDDYKQYGSCNVTDGRSLLDCKDETSGDQFIKLIFRAHAVTQGEQVFEKGKTYYLIGTGFRNKDQLSNLIGGSCNKTEVIASPYKQYKLRLKIYVCTDADISSGKCRTCTSNSCYSEECPKVCSEWVNYSSIPSFDYQRNTVTYQRTCNTTTKSNVIEQKVELRDCSMSCSDWKPKDPDESCLYVEGKNTIVHECGELLNSRKCFSTECGVKDGLFCMAIEHTCGPFTGSPNTAPQNGGSSAMDKTKIIILLCALSVVLYIVGILSGVIGHKKRHARHCLNPVMKHNQVTTEENTEGKVNLAFQYSVTGEKDDTLARKSVYFTDSKIDISPS